MYENRTLRTWQDEVTGEGEYNFYFSSDIIRKAVPGQTYETRGRDNKQTQPSGCRIWMKDNLVVGKKMLQNLKKAE